MLNLPHHWLFDNGVCHRKPIYCNDPEGGIVQYIDRCRINIVLLMPSVHVEHIDFHRYNSKPQNVINIRLPHITGLFLFCQVRVIFQNNCCMKHY